MIATIVTGVIATVAGVYTVFQQWDSKADVEVVELVAMKSDVAQGEIINFYIAEVERIKNKCAANKCNAYDIEQLKATRQKVEDLQKIRSLK